MKTRTLPSLLAVAPLLAIGGCGTKDEAPSAPAGAAAPAAAARQGGAEAAKKWIDSQFQPSVLSKEEQLKEMEWFVNAAKPFVGMEINVLSETIPTHEYESKTLTKAFQEITGIKVNHQLLGEGEVVQAVQTQMQTNRNPYDAYINDSDLSFLPSQPNTRELNRCSNRLAIARKQQRYHHRRSSHTADLRDAVVRRPWTDL